MRTAPSKSFAFLLVVALVLAGSAVRAATSGVTIDGFTPVAYVINTSTNAIVQDPPVLDSTPRAFNGQVASDDAVATEIADVVTAADGFTVTAFGSGTAGAGHSRSHGAAKLIVSFTTTVATSYSIGGTIKAPGGSAAASLTGSSGAGGDVFSFKAGANGGTGGEVATVKTGDLPAGSYALAVTCTSVGSGGVLAATHDITFKIASPKGDGTIRWRGPSGGQFSGASNWDTHSVPVKDGDHADTALFDRHGVYSVHVGAQTTERLLVTRGKPTFLDTDYTVDAISPIERSVVVTDDGELVLAGGTLRSRHAVLGENANSFGRVQVFNGGTGWEMTGALTIGELGTGGLFVANGGYVSSPVCHIGGGIAPGAAVIGGALSILHADELVVGSTSAADLTIEAGGFVGSHHADIGLGPMSRGAGAALVDGVAENVGASEWRIEGTLAVGVAAEGRLVVRDGGFVNTDLLLVGNSGGGIGNVTVTGGHSATERSELDSTADFVVGYGGAGSLRVEDGAIVKIAGDGVGLGAAIGFRGLGEVTVGGFNQRFAKGSELSFDSTSDFSVGTSSNGVGRLDVHGGGTVRVTCPSMLVGGSSGGTGIVTVSGSEGGPATMRVFGNLQVGGDTSVAGVVVLVDGGGLGVFGDLDVFANGTIQGNGVMAVTGTIYGDGFISPGLSPGTLTLDGNLVQGPTGVLFAEIAGPTPGEQHDRLVVTGNATLGGKLVLQFMNGYAPRKDDTYGVLEVSGAVTGDFATVDVAGLVPGAQFETTIAGGVLTAKALNDGVALPAVGIRTVGRSLSEKKKKSGGFTISRNGSTAAALTVTLAIGGGAQNGVDYVAIAQSVTLPARKKSVRVKVKPLADSVAESPETVEVRIVPGTDYAYSLQSHATVTIVDR